MKNRTFKHKVFLKDNNIDLATLSPLLKKRIVGFDELVEDYEHAVEEDQVKMEARITKLDIEIEEDLYDEYEQWLENNEDIEEEEKKIPAPQPEKKPEPAPKPIPSAPVKSNDVEIIEGLLKKGEKSIGRSDLRALGYKGKLDDKEHLVGNYKLKKALFSFTYYITPVKGK